MKRSKGNANQALHSCSRHLSSGPLRANKTAHKASDPTTVSLRTVGLSSLPLPPLARPSSQAPSGPLTHSFNFLLLLSPVLPQYTRSHFSRSKYLARDLANTLRAPDVHQSRYLWSGPGRAGDTKKYSAPPKGFQGDQYGELTLFGIHIENSARDISSKVTLGAYNPV